MDTTILKISNATNTFLDDYQIGNLLNKNLLIRNIALMRNIGKYSMYNQPMYPEVGMAYNVYERLLNRPSDIGGINGLVGYNNGVTDDINLNGINISSVIYGDAVNRFRKVEYNGNKKDIYVTNSESPILRGGEKVLGDSLAELNKHLRAENRYIIDDSILSAGWSTDNDPKKITMPTKRNWEGEYTETKVNTPTILVNSNDNEMLFTYNEGLERPSNVDRSYDEHLFTTEIDNFANYEANSKGWLLHKTNQLFAHGQINSIIDRFYAEEKDNFTDKKRFLSRGRNLYKEGATNLGGGYDNPYCRVWTVNHQYSKMTDLIRPRIKDEGGAESFATLAEIQGNYGEGLRPYNGAKRLSDMSVLKPNGFVNIAPHKTQSGELDKESIKKCMFSIENLAWKDVEIQNTTFKLKPPYQNKQNDRTNYNIGPTLTEEQRGPNGGRIMWFPPYNLKFSEDITTQWSDNTFIGRGEKIYSYVNTERGGSLSFTLLIDHPSIINKWRGKNPSDSFENEQKILRFFAGCDDLGDTTAGQDEVETETYDDVVERTVTPVESPKLETIKIFVFFPNNYSGIDDKPDDFADYLMNGGRYASNGYEVENEGHEIDNPIVGVGQTWYYRVDNKYKNQALVYYATKSGNNWDKYYKREKGKIVELPASEGLPNNGDITGFTLNNFDADSFKFIEGQMKTSGLIDETIDYGKTLFSFGDLYYALKNFGSYNTQENVNPVLAALLNNAEKIDHISVYGHASSHGDENKNDMLSKDRAYSVSEWLKGRMKYFVDGNKIYPGESKPINVSKGNFDVSSLEAKVNRSAVIEIYYDINKEKKQKKAARETVTKTRNIYRSVSGKKQTDEPYDNEYTYFRDIKESESFIKNRIIQKIQFFDPAYHSITPEGFNARLTFLHQCTRQGPTVSASDANGTPKDTGVGNLAFGRAPYCVLRIGDFYNTKILIESIQISYDNAGGVQWDLNPEGIGVQPMMADITLRFKFIGGSDISGPIERLQNAVSYNYYSNASIYDRRADHRESPDGDVQVYEAMLKNRDEKK